MRKLILGIFLGVFLALPATATAVMAKTAVLCTGVFGETLAPMTDYEAPLKKKGYRIVRATWLYFPVLDPDIVISHSACADRAPQMYPKAKHFPLDGTVLGLFTGCPKGTRCDNYYAPIDKFLFFICCGGYPTPGATTRTRVPGTISIPPFAPGHVMLPSRVRDQVMSKVP